MKQFIKNNFTTIVLVIALLSFFKSCGDSRELQNVKKELAQTNAKFDEIKSNVATREEVEIISNKVMFNFLIYEDDIDKRKTSLSDVKNKVDELNNRLNKK